MGGFFMGGGGGGGGSTSGNALDFGLGGVISSPFSSSGPFGYEKQRTEQESRTRTDPETERINALKRKQIEDILRITGGYEGLFGPKSDKLFQLSGQSQNILNRYIRQASQRGLTPEQWYRDAKRSVDPTTQIAAAKDVLNKVMTPDLQNRYSQMGLGRSGALGEGIAMAGTQLTLPIATQLQQQRFEIERQRPNLDVTLRAANLQRTQQAFASSDFQRRLDLANWQRKVGGMTSAFGMVPYVAGQDSTATTRQFGNLVMDLMDMAIGAIGAMYGGGGGASRQPQTLQPQDIGGDAPLSSFGPGAGGQMIPGIPGTSNVPSYMMPSQLGMYY